YIGQIRRKVESLRLYWNRMPFRGCPSACRGCRDGASPSLPSERIATLDLLRSALAGSALPLHHFAAFPQEGRNVEILRLVAGSGGPHSIERNHLCFMRRTNRIRFLKSHGRGIWLKARFGHKCRLGIGHRFGLAEVIPRARNLI